MAEQPRQERQLNIPVIAAGAVVALLGFAASLYLGLQGHGGAVAGPTKQIVVAAHDVNAHTALGSGDVQLGTYYTSDVPPGAYTKTSEVVGKLVDVPLKSGQPVLSNLLGTASLPVRQGYVAATVPSGELVGVGGYIKPGDYIDLIAVMPPRTGGFSIVRTVYPGVHVIQTSAAGSSVGTGPASSLTLEVSECQAEFISWFLANASLKYSLLSASDYATAAAQPRDTACPAAGSNGVTDSDVRTRWPGLIP